jgi:glutamine cyclotransferase
MTTNGTHFFLSDGSSELFILDAHFKFLSMIDVQFDGKPFGAHTELEMIHDRIWASQRHTSMFVIIDPRDGRALASGNLTRFDESGASDLGW